MSIRTEPIPRVTAVGTAGSSATGTQTSANPLNGRLVSIGVAQGNSPHANTDIVIAVSNGAVSRTLFTLTNYNATALTWFNPRGAVVSQSNAALVYAATDPVTDALPLNGYVTVTVTQGGSAATCDVTIVYED